MCRAKLSIVSVGDRHRPVVMCGLTSRKLTMHIIILLDLAWLCNSLLNFIYQTEIVHQLLYTKPNIFEFMYMTNIAASIFFSVSNVLLVEIEE